MLFSQEILIMPESPSPFLGRDVLRKVHVSVFINMEPVLLIEEYANPIVWADRKTGLNIKCCSSFYQPQ